MDAKRALQLVHRPLPREWATHADDDRIALCDDVAMSPHPNVLCNSPTRLPVNVREMAYLIDLRGSLLVVPFRAIVNGAPQTFPDYQTQCGGGSG